MPSNTKTTTKAKTPPKKKRVPLAVGDLVTIQSHISHMTGSFAEVVHVLDKDNVVVRGMGAQYADYDNRLWVALTYKPHGNAPDGEALEDITIWVRKVRYSRTELPPKRKKVKKIVEPTVITGVDGVIAALKSNEKHDAVVFVPDAKATP
jgi:hypothetical protein